MIPEQVQKIMTTIEENGFEVYIVGGSVRDYLLEKESNDFNLVTNVPLETIKSIIPKLNIRTSNNRSIGTLYYEDISVEITEFRGKNIEEDLNNRDYTVNAFAMDSKGNIYDPLFAIRDLQERKLKLVKENGEGLELDPVRILRAFRIADKYQLKIVPKTKQQILEKKDLLKKVPKDRITRELMLLLIGNNPAKYLREYREVFFVILPELGKTYGFEQHNPWHLYDVFEHTMKVLENTEPNPYLRLAALFHDIGKPEVFFTDEQNIGHFYGHNKESLRIFNRFASDSGLDPETIKIVQNLIYYHDGKLSTKRAKIRELIDTLGPETIRLLFALKKADNLGQNPELATKSLQEVFEFEQLYMEVMTEEPTVTDDKPYTKKK